MYIKHLWASAGAILWSILWLDGITKLALMAAGTTNTSAVILTIDLHDDTMLYNNHFEVDESKCMLHCIQVQVNFLIFWFFSSDCSQKGASYSWGNTVDWSNLWRIYITCSIISEFYLFRILFAQYWIFAVRKFSIPETLPSWKTSLLETKRDDKCYRRGADRLFQWTTSIYWSFVLASFAIALWQESQIVSDACNCLDLFSRVVHA